jgi:hypothetical protein
MRGENALHLPFAFAHNRCTTTEPFYVVEKVRVHARSDSLTVHLPAARRFSMKRRIDEAPAVASDDEGGSDLPNKRARALMQSPSVACQATPATPSLPPELWCHILSFLKNRSLFGLASLVCSSWRYAFAAFPYATRRTQERESSLLGVYRCERYEPSTSETKGGHATTRQVRSDSSFCEANQGMCGVVADLYVQRTR